MNQEQDRIIADAKFRLNNVYNLLDVTKNELEEIPYNLNTANICISLEKMLEKVKDLISKCNNV